MKEKINNQENKNQNTSALSYNFKNRRKTGSPDLIKEKLLKEIEKETLELRGWKN